jgi:hypothetical protein
MVPVEILALVQVLVTDRTSSLLPLGKLPLVICRGLGPRPSLSPVVLERWVVGELGGRDQPMSYDPCPGKFPKRGMPAFLPKDPSVLSTTDGATAIFLGSPPP